MKNILLLATALLIGTAGADNITGSQTTPLKLKVNNFCQLAYTNYITSETFSRTNDALDLGTINAVSNHQVGPALVASVDCNRKTVLNVITPTTLTLTNGTDSFEMTTDVWGPMHPLTMSFDQSGSFTNDIGFGPYDYHEVKASFHVGGTPTLANATWAIPGGNYTGDLVISYNYDE